jgi:hypothetical protein
MPRKRPRNPGGRPTKYTATRVLRLVAAVAEGQPRSEAATLAGIGDSTLERWLAAGRAGHPDFAPLVDAVERVERARALGVGLLDIFPRSQLLRAIRW